MKSDAATASPRSYRQGARAEAAEATGRRIVDALLDKLSKQWFEEITLESVAEDAGVSVQTIMRRFGSKNGLLVGATEFFEGDVLTRRPVKPGDIENTVNVLSHDYEVSGDLVLRLLAQEDRHPALKDATNKGRRGHRDWVAAVFADTLAQLPSGPRQALLDALVVATDLYQWKLLRRDMGRSIAAYKTLVANMLRAALANYTAPNTSTRK